MSERTEAVVRALELAQGAGFVILTDDQVRGIRDAIGVAYRTRDLPSYATVTGYVLALLDTAAANATTIRDDPAPRVPKLDTSFADQR